MEYVSYFWQYKDVAFDFLFAAHIAALVIANATPTPKDNEVLAKAYGALEFLAGIISRKAKS